MLILVGVTINFAINGGIINKAKTATSDMQKKADKEELQLAIIASTDYITGEVVRADLVSSLSGGWNVSNDAPYTCTSPSSNVFLVTADGKITEENSSNIPPADETPIPTELTDLEKYILGENGTGRPLSEIMNNISFVDDTVLTPNIDESEALAFTAFSYTDSGTVYFYILYNSTDLYRFKAVKVNENDTASILTNMANARTEQISNLERIKKITVADESVGNEVVMDGVQYVVLYGEGELGAGQGAQLITKYVMTDNGNEITLGYEDTTLNNVTLNPFNENKTKNDAEPYINLEKAIYSYNNVVKILNDKCSDLIMTGNINNKVASVRCVGSNPTSNPTSFVTEPVNPYTDSNINTWPANDEHYNVGVANGKGENTDSEFLADFDRLLYIGELDGYTTDNQALRYWFASRYVRKNDNNNGISYTVRFADPFFNGEFDLFRIDSNDISLSSTALPVRPVVTLKPGVLNSLH